MKIGGLVRCSTDRQNPTSQIEALEAWAKDVEHELALYVEPPGTSGGLPLAERKETTRLLADVAAKNVDAIVMCEVSRLNRLDAVENFIAIGQLWLAGVPLYVLDHDPENPLDLSDLGDFLRMAFECGFAAEERKKDSVRTLRTRRFKKDGAEVDEETPGARCFSYRDVRWGRPTTQLTPVDLEAARARIEAGETLINVASSLRGYTSRVEKVDGVEREVRVEDLPISVRILKRRLNGSTS